MAQSSSSASSGGQPLSSQTPSALLNADTDSLAFFKEHLKTSNRIIAIIGAGLSVASGVPTFRDSTSPWSTYDSFMISSPAGFKRDPGLVWQFYSDRRREALTVAPNQAHYALVDLAEKKKGFVALSQNVDGLLERAGLRPWVSGTGGLGLEGREASGGTLTRSGQLIRLHGDLFSLICAGECGYVERDNFSDPVYGCQVLTKEAIEERMNKVKILGANMDLGEKPPKASALLFEAIASKNKKILGEGKFVEVNPTTADAKPLRDVQGVNDGHMHSQVENKDGEGEELKGKKDGEAPSLHSGINSSELPQCPACKADLLRPGVVWFGEALSESIVAETDKILDRGEKIDLCIVIGTSSQVWPAAGFCERARARGAKVAWVNTRMEDCKSRREEDWVFLGDAGLVVPKILGFEKVSK